MATTNNLRDINGKKIKVGQVIIGASKRLLEVIEEDGELGFTEKNKNPNFNHYRSIYLFLESDDMKVFEIISEPTN